MRAFLAFLFALTFSLAAEAQTIGQVTTASGKSWTSVYAPDINDDLTKLYQAPYVMMANQTGFSAERALAAGAMLGLSDGGGGADATFSVTDAELLCLGGLTSAASRLPYFTGSGTCALTVFGASGRDLLAETVADDTVPVGDSASAYTMRTLPDCDTSTALALQYDQTTNTFSCATEDADITSWAAITRAAGFDAFAATPSAANFATLVTGESYGLTDAELACIAGQTSAADKFTYWTGSGTCGLADLSSAMRTFLTTPTTANFAAVTSDEAAGWATWVVTPSSANLRTFLTDEIGTGSAMFGLISTMADDLGCTGGQVVRRNAGDTAFECAADATGSGITDIVQDTTPQLGGALDGNNFKINATATATDAGLNLEQTTAPSAPVDGDVWATSVSTYAKINGQSGLLGVDQYMVLQSNYTLTNNTSPQKLFNGGTGSAGAFNAKSSTLYEFEIVCYFSSAPGTSGASLNLSFSGTATTSRITAVGGSARYIAGSTGGAVSGNTATTLPTASLVSSTSGGTGTEGTMWARGTIKVTTAGTIIPRMEMNTASSAMVNTAGSFWRMRAIGVNTMATQGDF